MPQHYYLLDILVLTVFGPAGIWDVIGRNVVWNSDFFSTDCLFVFSVFDVFSNQLLAETTNGPLIL